MFASCTSDFGSYEKFLEEFISGYVNGLSQEEWLGLLHLEPA